MAVRGIKPELPHPVIFAGFPSQGGMKSQVRSGIFTHGSLCVLSGFGLNGSGVYPHLGGRQNRRSHLKPFEKNRQANLLCARQNIPQQRGIRGGERNPVPMRRVHILPRARDSVYFGEEPFVLGVHFVTTDRPTHAGREGLPAEPALDPAPGFGLHQRSRQQVDRRGCTGNIAPARI